MTKKAKKNFWLFGVAKKHFKHYFIWLLYFVMAKIKLIFFFSYSLYLKTLKDFIKSFSNSYLIVYLQAKSSFLFFYPDYVLPHFIFIPINLLAFIHFWSFFSFLLLSIYWRLYTFDLFSFFLLLWGFWHFNNYIWVKKLSVNRDMNIL